MTFSKSYFLKSLTWLVTTNGPSPKRTLNLLSAIYRNQTVSPTKSNGLTTCKLFFAFLIEGDVTLFLRFAQFNTSLHLSCLQSPTEKEWHSWDPSVLLKFGKSEVNRELDCAFPLRSTLKSHHHSSLYLLSPDRETLPPQHLNQPEKRVRERSDTNTAKVIRHSSISLTLLRLCGCILRGL